MTPPLWTPRPGLSVPTGPSRRAILQSAGLATAALSTSALLAACGGDGPSGGSGKNKTLDFWQFYAPAPTGEVQGTSTKTQADWFTKTTQEWNKNNQTQVSLTYVPTSSYLAGDKLATQFASGKGPDIFLISSALFLEYYNAGVMLDLTPYLSDEAKADFESGGVMGTRKEDGKIYGLPLESEPLLMYYSQDAFEKAGLSEGDVPQTWDQLLNVADKLTGSGRYGLLWETTPGALQNFEWEPLMWQGGGDAVSPDGKAVFDSPGTIQALKLWQDSINRKVSPRTVKNGNSGDVLGNLASGYVAMQQMVSAIISILNENAPDFKYGTFKLPIPSGGQYKTTSGGWAAVVNKKGKDPETAAKFVTWAFASTDQEGVTRMADWATVAKKGDLSPRTSVNEFARTRGYFDDPNLKYVLDEVIGDGSGVRGEPRYPGPVFKAVSDAIQGSMLNGTPPAEAAGAANNTIDNFLKGYRGGAIL